MTGVILAGGKSKRMGREKAFVKLGGQYMIDRILSKLEAVFDEVIIVSNTPQMYEYTGFRVVEDKIKHIGPLAGVYTGLMEAAYERCFVTACDLPFLDVNIIRYLASFKNEDAVVPEINGLHEPLAAIYSKACIPAIENCLSRKEYKVTSFYKDVALKTVSEDELKVFDPDLHSFININTEIDLQKLICLSSTEL